MEEINPREENERTDGKFVPVKSTLSRHQTI